MTSDVQELFRLEKRGPFARLFEMLLVDSGGIFEATRFARACEVSRQTVMNYLEVLEATFVMHVVRPFASSPSAEIVAAPRVYGFDTGLVAYHRGWSPLRRDDHGPLWEHLVLNELHAERQRRDVQYWRTKSGHEVDFVVAPMRATPIAIECKWSQDAFDPAGMLAFRQRYPVGENILVAADVKRARESAADTRARGARGRLGPVGGPGGVGRSWGIVTIVRVQHPHILSLVRHGMSTPRALYIGR